MKLTLNLKFRPLTHERNISLIFMVTKSIGLNSTRMKILEKEKLQWADISLNWLHELLRYLTNCLVELDSLITMHFYLIPINHITFGVKYLNSVDNDWKDPILSHERSYTCWIKSSLIRCKQNKEFFYDNYWCLKTGEIK